jgi:predicted permease
VHEVPSFLFSLSYETRQAFFFYSQIETRWVFFLREKKKKRKEKRREEHNWANPEKKMKWAGP